MDVKKIRYYYTKFLFKIFSNCNTVKVSVSRKGTQKRKQMVVVIVVVVVVVVVVFNIRLHDILRLEEEPIISSYKKIPIPDFMPLIIDIYLDISPCLTTKKVYIRNEEDKNNKDNFVEIDTTSSSSRRQRQKKKIILLERWRLSLT
ncbi:hypothetical protein PIROE2DRAFT_11115 [Piromyces sp. E2]|nr:hypothetical protein PIROE2DRAFT_11115 [Piromyces sp. E2]|eukprot:OUM62585.1 hypothetical protein PIROE2DRAFT_11115 [Piromyces sp. E2]